MADSTHSTEILAKHLLAPTEKSPSTPLKILGLLLVLIGTILINYNYNNRLDIISDDDDLYFSFGMMLLKGKYRGADDGPLYYVFQLLLQLITNDAIRTFYINYIVTTSVPMVIFYLLLRARNINIWVAVWITLMFTFSNLNYPLTPKLTHYAVIFLLAGLLTFTYCEGLLRKFFFTSLFVLFAIINDKMNGYFAKDATYHNFLAHPESKGFVLVKETGSHKVFARKEII